MSGKRFIVVPANAGTHNHSRSLLNEMLLQLFANQRPVVTGPGSEAGTTVDFTPAG